jgi:hypothetical protein
MCPTFRLQLFNCQCGKLVVEAMEFTFLFEIKIILKKKSDFSPFAFTLDTTLCFVHGFYFRKV